MTKTFASAESAILGLASLNPITAAIAAMYSIGKNINDFMDEHIENMKSSEDPVIASTGRVLGGAKFGFGLGYLSSVAIIAVGQVILGNTLAAVTTVGSAAILTNPIAMTCGAIGAIYYGWKALTNQEKERILDKITTGLEIGVELIKSLIDFVTKTMTDLFDPKHLAKLKEFVKTQAQQFGKSLYSITKTMSDGVIGAFTKASELAGEAVKSTSEAVKNGSEIIGLAAGKVGYIAGQVADSTAVVTKSAIDTVSQAASNVSDTASEAAKNIKGIVGDK
jgi:hypothetical protein